MSDQKKKPVFSSTSTDLAEQLCAVVKSQKRVTKSDEAIIAMCESLCDYIDYFNSLNEDSMVVFPWTSPTPIDRVPILCELEEFIFPASVKAIAGNRRCVELLIRVPSDQDFSHLNLSHYLNLLNEFRGTFKVNNIDQNVTTLSNLKKELSFFDVITKASFSGMVNYDGDPFYPVPLSDDATDFVGTKFALDPQEQLISDFVAKLRF